MAESTWKLFVLWPEASKVLWMPSRSHGSACIPCPTLCNHRVNSCARESKLLFFLREWEGDRAPLLLDVPPNLTSPQVQTH